MQQILIEFEDVFQDPQGLPPQTYYDHQIPLKDGISPIHQKPYRYHIAEKRRDRRMTRELQATGFIRDNHSPFCSPTILVKKKR